MSSLNKNSISFLVARTLSTPILTARAKRHCSHHLVRLSKWREKNDGKKFHRRFTNSINRLDEKAYRTTFIINNNLFEAFDFFSLNFSSPPPFLRFTFLQYSLSSLSRQKSSTVFKTHPNRPFERRRGKTKANVEAKATHRRNVRSHKTSTFLFTWRTRQAQIYSDYHALVQKIFHRLQKYFHGHNQGKFYNTQLPVCSRQITDSFLM